MIIATGVSKKDTKKSIQGLWEGDPVSFHVVFYLCRVSLVRFKSIKTQLKEKGELEEFWRNHHPDIFARRHLYCFPPDLTLSVGTASERLYDYMNVSTVMVTQPYGLSSTEGRFFPLEMDNT